tara:strand:- start:1433 stop:2317 length:885 start_codon:yes stop_codon:yes gene_type:complete
MFGTTTYHQTIRKMVVAFGTLFNDISIKRTNSSGQVIETLKVPVAYGPKQKFMVRIGNPNLTGPAVILPRIGFMMSQIMYDGTRKLITVGQNKANINGTLRSQYNPVPYNFIFDLAILAKNAEDAAQIVEQILPNFTPEFTVTINMVPSMDIKTDVPIILNSVNYMDAYDGDFETRRSLSWDMQFTMKSFMYPEIEENKKVIKDISITLSIPGGSSTEEIGSFDYFRLEDSTHFTINTLLNENGTKLTTETSDHNLQILGSNETIGITPSPLDATGNDDFGFSLSINDEEVKWI